MSARWKFIGSFLFGYLAMTVANVTMTEAFDAPLRTDTFNAILAFVWAVAARITKEDSHD